MPNEGLKMHDSGERQEFESGAVRDTAEGKPRPDLISPHFSKRLGFVLKAGAEKYEERNFEKGIQISRCVASLERHLMEYKLGKTDEDHLGHLAANVMMIIHFEEEIAAGRLPEDLSDMPFYEQRPKIKQSREI